MTSYLDQIEIASPCPASWDAMMGNDITRHCNLCNLNVYNLSGMSKKEAEEFLAQSIPKGRVCAKFYRRADGTIITDDCPRGLRALCNTARSIGAKAAALIALLISCFPAYSQSQNKQEQYPQPQKAGNPAPPSFVKPKVPPVSEKHGRGSEMTLGVIIERNYSQYMSNLRNKIKKCWAIPEKYKDKVVVVTFKIHTGGQLSNLKLQRSSGFEVTDKAAILAVERAAPFDPLPKGSTDTVDIEFTFDEKLNHNNFSAK